MNKRKVSLSLVFKQPQLTLYLCNVSVFVKKNVKNNKERNKAGEVDLCQANFILVYIAKSCIISRHLIHQPTHIVV